MRHWLIGGAAAGLAAAVATPMPSAAQSVPAQPTNDVNLAGDRLTIGIGAASVPDYVGARESGIVPAIAIQGQVSGRSFNSQGTSLTVDVVKDDGMPGWKVQAGPMLNVRVDRGRGIRQPQVAALGRLKTAWEPGAWIGIQRTGVVTSLYDTLSANISWQRDVGGAHGGTIIGPAVSYGTPLSHRDYISLSGGADHVDARFGDYYYDVSDTGAAASGLRRYAAADRAGWKDWNLSVLAAHAIRGDLTRGLQLFATMGYTRLIGRYARSPIVADVGDANQWGGAAGIAITL